MPPAPGTMPRDILGRMAVTTVEKTWRVVQRASSRRPPRTIEERAAMVGYGDCKGRSLLCG